MVAAAPEPAGLECPAMARASIVVAFGLALGGSCTERAAAGGGSDARPKVVAVANEEIPRETRDAVNKAIARAVGWLRDQQTADGRFGGFALADYPDGEAALATFTLLQCGYGPDDAIVSRALTRLRAAEPATTYEAGLCCLAIGAIADATGDPFAEDAVDARGRPVIRAAARERLTEADTKALLRWTGFLRKRQCAPRRLTGGRLVGTETAGGWGYGKSWTSGTLRGLRSADDADAQPFETADASNTQIALLGLKAAARCGIEIPADVWRRALSFVLACQRPKGPGVDLRANEVVGARRLEWTELAHARGFGYGPFDDRPSGSLTAAGVAGLILCTSELEAAGELDAALSARATEGVRDGLAWIQTHFSVSKNPGGASNDSRTWQLYYLYALERAGSLTRTRFLGGEDWYVAGARHLMSEQRRDGSFDFETADTCFALLFLRRATVRTNAHVITPSDPPAAGEGSTAPARPPK